MSMSPKPGSYSMPMSEYLALPYLSSGLCNTLLTSSPAHAKWALDHRILDANEASDTGTAIHDGLLEGVDRIAVIDAQDWRTKAAKAARDDARAMGMIPLLAAKAGNVREAIEAAKLYVSRSQIAGIFDSGKPEQTILWVETEDNGEVYCKARPDWHAEAVLHVKTTKGSAQPEAWIRNQLVASGYDVAAMFYERATNGAEQIFLVIEQQAPFGCSLVGLSPSMAEIAAAKIERAIRTWAQCQASKIWPMYPSKICYADPTNWQMAEHEEHLGRDRLSEDELSGGIPA